MIAQPLMAIRTKARLFRWQMFWGESKGWRNAITALLVLLHPAWTGAAEKKQWITLANCQYVAHSGNDGDSFRVRCGTEQFILRLYFVDAPEANLTYSERTREQSEHFGTTLDETLRSGAKAREFVRDTLRGSFVVITRKASAPGRSAAPRYYGLVQIGNKGLDEILVSQGLARTKGVAVNLPSGEKSRSHVDRLRTIEAQARQQRRGVWASSAKPKS